MLGAAMAPTIPNMAAATKIILLLISNPFRDSSRCGNIRFPAPRPTHHETYRAKAHEASRISARVDSWRSARLSRTGFPNVIRRTVRRYYGTVKRLTALKPPLLLATLAVAFGCPLRGTRENEPGQRISEPFDCIRPLRSYSLRPTGTPPTSWSRYSDMP